MNLQPLYDRVLVKRDEAPTISSTIWVPRQAPEQVQTGTVIACGPGFRDDKGIYHPLTVKEGDKVAFNRQAGAILKGKDDDDELIVMREFDLLGRINPEAADDGQPTLFGSPA